MKDEEKRKGRESGVEEAGQEDVVLDMGVVKRPSSRGKVTVLLTAFFATNLHE